MATKTLNTRIQLKYDSYSEWTSKNPTLLAGEMAIATLGNAADKSTITPDNGTHPIVIKVGPGAYNSLPFVSALAADVYSWAKQDEATFVANFLNLKTSNNKTMKDVLDGIFATDAELTSAIGGVQTSINGIIERVAALEGKVDVEKVSTAISTAVAGETSRATGVESGLDSRITALEGASATHATITALNAEIERATAAEAKAFTDAKTYTNEEIVKVNNAITNADYASKTEAQGYANTAQSNAEQKAAELVNAHTEAVNTKFNSYSTTTEMNAAIDADVLVETNRATAAEEALGGRIKDLEDNKADYATKTEAQGYANGAETNAKAYAKEYADAVKASILTGDTEGTLKDTYDTLLEIQQWIEGDGVNTTELTTAIATETENRQKADEAINNTIATLETKSDASAKLAEAKGYTDTEVAKDRARIKALEDVSHDFASADAALKAELQAEIDADVKALKDTEVAANTSAIGTINNTLATYGDVVTHNHSEYATAAQGAKADTALQAADKTELSNAIAALAGSGNNTTVKANAEAIGAINNTLATYGDIVTHNHAEYASAAQGAKADSALQEITTTANGGLIVTNKNKIDIDDSITFIFNCGSASQVF